jgi:histidinol-phosphate/aromatic aminotransferase/cobyric acid decarboxylase-like protein
VQWIKAGTLNTIQGIDNFPIAAFSAGTTEAFDKFYLKNRGRRIRYFRGEYMYHQIAGREYFEQAEYIEDSDLELNDVVVISLPFADTGGEHPDMQSMLSQCERLNIPVLVDCAYFGICAGILFDFNYSCITDITFSLSKSFPVPHLRIGMRLTRTDDDDALLVSNKTQYINRISAAVGLKVLNKYNADSIYKRYVKTQNLFCADLGVNPSPCVIFGIDLSNSYPQYNRGARSNRLCFAKYLDFKQLPK